MTRPNLQRLTLNAETKYVLGVVADECDKKSKEYFDVGMGCPASVYMIVAMQLRDLVSGRVPPIPKVIFSHPERDDYY